MKISKSIRNTEFSVENNSKSFDVVVSRNYKKDTVLSYLYNDGIFIRKYEGEEFNFELTDEELVRLTVETFCESVKKTVDEFNERNGNYAL